jgi:hypothetical protein
VADQPRPPADAPLQRRVAGAQLPDTSVVPLHEEPNGNAPSPETRAAASDVHSMLTSFSEGVQRGVAEARRGSG